MGGKKSGGENTKKAAGNAKKAEAAAQKQSVANAKAVAAEDREWAEGAKNNVKKQSEADKKAEAARKKVEREALLAEEEKSQRATPKGANAKSAPKKSKGTAGTLDLSQLDNSSSSPATDTTTTTASPGNKAATLNASGIENALDALNLSTQQPSAAQKVERHPERRYKAAYTMYEEQRRAAVAKENPGLRKNQRDQIIRKEFEKSEDNPFNQVGVVGFDADRDEVREMREKAREEVEGRLAEKT